ncbi:hypothetical protein NDU88_012041 [Pleurodeles waltl]|uniref:Uncharacterized protein n=1 Tax=Pleurodeles waltl TaxID=8319 RepID=A0AAV7R257_PLEWA|nr:hypothetical protein NDU88_012041 [Pleurodeles waltl]
MGKELGERESEGKDEEGSVHTSGPRLSENAGRSIHQWPAAAQPHQAQVCGDGPPWNPSLCHQPPVWGKIMCRYQETDTIRSGSIVDSMPSVSTSTLGRVH